MCDKRDRAIACEFCGDLHLPLIFSGLLQKKLFKERCEVCRKGISSKIIVMLVIQGLPSSFLSRPDS